jgi:hypothetical protein
VQSADVERKPQKPQSIEELIPAMVRYAIKQSLGLGISEFDEKLLPRMKDLLPAGSKDAPEAIREHLLALGHASCAASSKNALCSAECARLSLPLTSLSACWAPLRRKKTSA